MFRPVMKTSVALCVLLTLAVIGFGSATASLATNSYSTTRADSSTSHGSVSFSTQIGKDFPASRKLKEMKHIPRKSREGNHVNLEDYGPVDPSPSSKTSVIHGPIVHGAPLMPYIPKPAQSPPPRSAPPSKHDDLP